MNASRKQSWPEGCERATGIAAARNARRSMASVKENRRLTSLLVVVDHGPEGSVWNLQTRKKPHRMFFNKKKNLCGKMVGRKTLN